MRAYGHCSSGLLGHAHTHAAFHCYAIYRAWGSLIGHMIPCTVEGALNPHSLHAPDAQALKQRWALHKARLRREHERESRRAERQYLIVRLPPSLTPS